jgi:hypothetical protein
LVFGADCLEAAYTLLGEQVLATIGPIVVAFLASALSLPMFPPFVIWQWSNIDLARVGCNGWAAVT